MIIVSPWTKGGYVSSEVFDHTSLIRFLEARFAAGRPGLIEENITPWRRAVAGDLTSAFDFAHPDDALASLPSTAGFPPPDRLRHPDDVVVAPADQAMPASEQGVRRARAVPYELHVRGSLHPADGTFRLDLGNTGRAAAVFQVRSANPAEGPRSYTVEPGRRLAGTWQAAGAGGAYDLSVYGPNGFTRTFRGGALGGDATRLDVLAEYESGEVALAIANLGSRTNTVSVVDRYTGKGGIRLLAPGERWGRAWPSRRGTGWYDLVVSVKEDPGFEYGISGHVETGREGLTDPAIGSETAEP
jgi:phospholipase C